MAEKKISKIRMISMFLVLVMLMLSVGCRQDQPDSTAESTTESTTEATQAKSDISKPLTLQVLSGDVRTDAIVGTYSWNYTEDGQWKAANASSAHPLDCKNMLTVFTAGAETARLEFGDQPDHISVRCWRDEHFGDPYAEAETVTMNGYTAYLKSGSYVYEVAARWDDEGGEYHGTAYYCFYAEYAG